jgi:Archaeal holliday junction resolvase (hjc)
MTDAEIKTRRAKAARRRGKRGEYGLRNYLRSLGWIADRVPTSGAAQGFKGDVVATRGSRKLIFECKNHSKKYAGFWTLIDDCQRSLHDDLLSVAVPQGSKICVDISTSLDAVFDSDSVYTVTSKHPLYEKHKRTFDRLETLSKLLGEADILVLKDNHRPFLFFRFR